MLWRFPSGFAGSRRILFVALTVGILSLSAVPIAGAAAVPRGPVSGAEVPVSTPAVSHSFTPATPSAARPAPSTSGTSGNETFYQNSTLRNGVPSSAVACEEFNYPTYAYHYCYNWTVNPSLVFLGGNDLGVAYQVDGDSLGASCSASLQYNYTYLIAFARSSNNGTSWGAPALLGNKTCGAYSNAVEPSFASTDGGSVVYGAFVEDNESRSTYSIPGVLESRSPSAIGFVKSTNHGGTFSTTVTLPSGSFVAHPELAAFGNSVYLVWENVSNVSYASIPAGGPFYTPYINPVSVEFMASTDGGTTWTSPQTLAGFNATAYYFSLSPSIAVNATGTVAVSYFSDESCIWMDPYCENYGMNLYVVASTTNGTSWTAPSAVQDNLAMSNQEALFYYDDIYQTPPSAWIPQSQVIFSSDSTSILVAYDAAIDTPEPYQNPNYEYSAVFFASGPSTGLGPWANQAVGEANYSGTESSYFLPTLGESASGTIYYAYEVGNATSCSVSGCPIQAGAMYEELISSSNGGVTWSSPALLNAARDSATYSSPYDFEQNYQGYQASVAFSSAGNPVVAYPSPAGYSFSTFYNGTADIYTSLYPTHILVATPYNGSSVAVTFQESGLTSPDWSFTIGGATVSVVGSTTYTVLNVPYGIVVSVSPNAGSSAYGEEDTASSSVGPEAAFTTATTVYFNYSVNWQFQLFVQPDIFSDLEIDTVVDGQYYDVFGYTDCFGTTCTVEPLQYSPSLPWYFPNGTVVDVGGNFDYGGVSFYNGTGNGSSTGVGSQVNVTMDHYINETAWVGGFGVYDEQFRAQGIPTTSVFHYDFNGSTHSAPASQSSYVDGVLTGSYAVSNIWANSSTPGDEYFGAPSTGSTVIVPAQPIVNLTFALVDLASAPGTVTFHATGLTAGTTWHFEFNGTEYSSSTPYLNVTTRSGTFPVAGFPVVSANGTVGYAPVGLATSMSVSTGSTYSISFTNAYRVDAQAGTGGSISGTGHGTLWIASGTNASFHAVANTNYIFGGWSGSGAGSYTGNSTYANVTVNAAMTEVAGFYPVNANRFNLTFHENGLAPGTWWTVYLGGKGYSGASAQIVVPDLYPCGPSGTYNLSVPYAYLNGSQLTRFVPGGYPKTVCTSGLTVQTLDFAPEYFVTLQSTEGGIGEMTVGSLTTTTSLWVMNQSSVGLSVSANVGYAFLGWNGTGIGSYTGTSPDQGIVVSNPITELAAFGIPVKPAPARYWEDIEVPTTFAAGTAWSVTLGGTSYSSTGTMINVTGLLANTYPLTVLGAFSPDGLTRYSPLSPPATIAVTHNGTTKLTYSVAYWVTVSAGAGGTVAAPTTADGWYNAGSTLALSASPAATYDFLGWVGTGTGSYSGSSENQSVTVQGPISEIASFGQAPPAAKVVTQSSIWQNSTLWIGLAAVGLIVAMLLGLLIGRRRSGGGTASVNVPPSEGASTTPPGESPPEGGS